MPEAKPARSAPRGVARLLSAALLALALVFAIGEVGVRVVHGRDVASLRHSISRADDARPDGLPIFYGAQDLNAPQIDGVFQGQRYRTDAIGFRGADREPVARPGTRRVIVTGDSVAMGSGVAEADAFPAVAEAWLNVHAAPPQWEVINAAIAGANSKRALKRLRKGIDHYGASVYVYAFMPDDIEGRFYERFPSERTAIDLIREAGWPAKSSSALIRILTWSWLDLEERIQALNLAHYTREVGYNFFENPPAWGALLHDLDGFTRMARQHDRCAVVLMLTRLVALEPDTHPFVEIYDTVASEARARGIHVIETRATFFGLDAEDIRHSPLDAHPNVAGHALLGELLVEGLRDLPDGCWPQ